jgi:hypothetical protein
LQGAQHERRRRQHQKEEHLSVKASANPDLHGDSIYGQLAISNEALRANE